VTVQPDDAPWVPFEPVHVAGLLQGVDVPWAVAGGHALDLFVGRTTRGHEDLEIAVPSERFTEVAEPLAVEFHVPVAAGVLAPLAGRRLEEFDSHQTWGLDPAAPAWRIDVFREPTAAGNWVCRRDPRIALPYSEAVERSVDNVPYLRPEIVLLFKAKAARDKDTRDLETVLPHLSSRRRALLLAWLDRVHPGHAWAQRLSMGTNSRSS
jgi:hypothetical protein